MQKASNGYGRIIWHLSSKMSNLVITLEYIRVYKDDLLTLIEDIFNDNEDSFGAVPVTLL